MRNDEKTEIDCVCESEGTPAVCLSCTREDCVEPAEMTKQTRAVTCGTDDRLHKHTLAQKVCAVPLLECVCICELPMIHAE